DVVVATRFHNVVSALIQGRPILSIGYATKNDVLLAEAGMGELCQHIEHLELELLKDQFRVMFDRREEFADGARRMSSTSGREAISPDAGFRRQRGCN
ncbi:MAG: hypothetical protein ACXW2T_09320, partial [Allosphingosinicella sp.]